MTTEGKSTLARALFLTAAAPRYVIDPFASAITAVPGAATFSDPSRLPDAATARFVPHDPEDLDAYDELYRQIRLKVLRAAAAGHPADAHAYIWCDEAGTVLPVAKTPKHGRLVLMTGAKMMIGHLGIHVRPRDVNRHCIAQAAHVGIWDLGLEEDRRYVAGLADLPYDLLSQGLAQRGGRGLLWWNRRAKRLTPLQVELAP